MTFPSITHVAVTVSDLDVSVPWYDALFGARAVLDEDTGPFRHVVYALGDTLFGLHQFPDPAGGSFDERARASTTSPSASRTATSWWSGSVGSRSSAWTTAASSTPATAPACPSGTPTASPSSSSPRRPEHEPGPLRNPFWAALATLARDRGSQGPPAAGRVLDGRARPRSLRRRCATACSSWSHGVEAGGQERGPVHRFVAEALVELEGAGRVVRVDVEGGHLHAAVPERRGRQPSAGTGRPPGPATAAGRPSRRV